MHSGEGEVVPFSEELYPTGNVEDWLLEVERIMKVSLENILHQALMVYPEVVLNLLVGKKENLFAYNIFKTIFVLYVPFMFRLSVQNGFCNGRVR